MKQPISITIRREPEPLHRFGWKYVAYRDEEVSHPGGPGYGVAVELYPLYMAAETLEGLLELLSQSSESIKGIHLPGEEQ